MLVAIGFFAVWMFLFYRFPSWWFFGITSTLILGLAFIGGLQLHDGRLGVAVFSYWAGYAGIWLIIGVVVRSLGARAAARRKTPKGATISETFS